MSAVLKEVKRPRRNHVTATAYIGQIDVEVDLADINTEDLEEELAERDDRGQASISEALDAIFYAMSAGQRDKAWELMRAYVQDATGRVLP